MPTPRARVPGQDAQHAAAPPVLRRSQLRVRDAHHLPGGGKVIIIASIIAQILEKQHRSDIYWHC